MSSGLHTFTDDRGIIEKLGLPTPYKILAMSTALHEKFSRT
jgi:hypothetical protein